MKIKVGKWRVDTKTLIEFRKEGKLPRLYVHEKFEKPLRWIVWIISFISFITIFIALDSYFLSVGIGLCLFGLSFVFDRAIVKYTSIVVQPLPEFEIDYNQWINVMTVSEPDYKKHINLIGFVYKDMVYGKRFFNYIKEWNFREAIDKDANIILSIVEENDGAYTFYLYANPSRKNLDLMFKDEEIKTFMSKSKKDKVQERLVMEMAYWHTIHYTDNKHMRDF